MKSASMVRRVMALVVFLSLAGNSVCIAREPLTISEIFAQTPPWGAQPSRVLWSPLGRSFLYLQTLQDPGVAPLMEYDVIAGRSRVVVDPAGYGAPLRAAAAVSWSPDGRSLAFVMHGVLYVRDMATGFQRIVARDVDDALWSPQSTSIGYVHQADLYVATLLPKLRIDRLTTTGSPGNVLNGEVDWVYKEEFSTQHGFAWSPDGASIAYMQMDERPVTNFPIVDFSSADNPVNYERYPLAGERNPRVTLHMVDVRTVASRMVYDAGAHDEYMPFFGWKNNANALIAEFIDRSQKKLRVDEWSNPAARPYRLYAQTDQRWVDAVPLPVWLSANESVWLLERDNTLGVYLRGRTGRLRRLSGAYRVNQVLAVDRPRHLVYAVGAFPTRSDRSLLALSLSGGPPRNLTPVPGDHRVALSAVAQMFLDTHSTFNDPPQTDLVAIDGSIRSTLFPRNEALSKQLLTVQPLAVDSPYGTLDAYMIRPPDFDRSRRYPVVIYTYGGPEMPTTQNTFGYQLRLYHQVLAQAGIIVFCIDGPGSQIDNEAHVRLLYHDLGPGSLLGEELGVQYLRTLPYVDPARIGIWGWSFGGYEAAYALTHSAMFKAAVAAAPVTDWRLYDSVYTERYMGAPQDNKRSYDDSSVLAAAGNLRGDLLIVHGTADDNVHLSNSMVLMQRLAAANQTHVEILPYPRERHTFTGLDDLRDLYEHMFEWWSAHL